LEDIADRVIVNYELLQEENKLLMKEKEFYFDSKLKKLSKETETLISENIQLKEMIKMK
jgi:hypothetical protein